MIFVLSLQSDPTSSEITEWFDHLNKPFFRCNTGDPVRVIRLSLDELVLKIRDQIVDLNQVTAFVYRWGSISLMLPLQLNDGSSDSEMIRHHLVNNWERVDEFIIHKLESSRCFGKKSNSKVNKLLNLKIAASSGLTIPETLVSGSGRELKAFMRDHASITKPISEMFSGYTEKAFFESSTTALPEVTLEYDEDVQPSLLQRAIPKKYELRITFFDNNLWAMALMSQLDSGTSVDWRSSSGRETRIVPYVLPDDIQEKLHVFCRSAGYDSGSVDMIVTPDDEFVFLEINPLGHYVKYSGYCNYPISKTIATIL
jgi:hypothetical protein